MEFLKKDLYNNISSNIILGTYIKTAFPSLVSNHGLCLFISVWTSHDMFTKRSNICPLGFSFNFTFS